MLRFVIFLLYRLLQWVVSPFIVLYFLNRGRRDRRYLRNFTERLGRLPKELGGDPGGVWIHGVSVGEVMASLRLIDHLRAELPGVPVFLSCGTVAGRALADEKAASRVDGIFYAPIDYCFAVRSVLRILRPRIVVILETEIWPNLYREVKYTGAALWIVNGRISDRALVRYRRIRPLLKEVLALPDRILAQTSEIAGRFRAIGAPADRVGVGGNLKYDFDAGAVPVPPAVESWLEALRPGRIWVAASTMPAAVPGDPDEDEVVLDAFQALAVGHPDLLLILAPRRPERFQEAALRLERCGIRFIRRSAMAGEAPPFQLPGVLLLDTIGELAGVFRVADVVFMGGTLPHRGGHNPLEPAYFDKPVVAGPHMENFQAIADRFDAAGAWVRVTSPADLAGAVGDLLDHPELRRRTGARGGEVARAEQGAAARLAVQLAAAWQDAVVERWPWRLYTPALALLSCVWRAGAALDRARKVAFRRTLPVPVVSLGNLTAGGTGKTPLALWLAGRLREAGQIPVILTRGYGRESRQVVLCPPGSQAPVAETGDEAQVYLKNGSIGVAVHADRYRAGSEYLARHPASVFLLDDGFQHHRLSRSVDLVLVDSTDPFGGGRLIPAGRLRESKNALRRASAFVLTRCVPGRRETGLIEFLHRFNPAAPVFQSEVEPQQWVEYGSNALLPPGGLPPSVVAFCGLGNPATFWRALRQLGVRPVLRRTFPDHHRYTSGDLQQLCAQAVHVGAVALVTTEKDAANLPVLTGRDSMPMQVYALRITSSVDPELLTFVASAIAAPDGD